MAIIPVAPGTGLQGAVDGSNDGDILQLDNGEYPISNSGGLVLKDRMIEIRGANPPRNYTLSGAAQIGSFLRPLNNSSPCISVQMTGSTTGPGNLRLRDLFIGPQSRAPSFDANGHSVDILIGYYKNIYRALNGTPIIVQMLTGTHGLSYGERVYITGVLGNTAANGIWVIHTVDSQTFTLWDPNTGAASVGNGTPVSNTGTFKKYGAISGWIELIGITTYFSSGHGIRVTGEVDNMTLDNVQCASHRGHGIYFAPDAVAGIATAYPQIVNGQILGCDKSGIRLDNAGGYCRIDRQTVGLNCLASTDPTDAQISITGLAASSARIHATSIEAFTDLGHGAGGAAIHVGDQAQGVFVVGCLFQNGDSLVRLRNYPKFVKVRQCVVRPNVNKMFDGDGTEDQCDYDDTVIMTS